MLRSGNAVNLSVEVECGYEWQRRALKPTNGVREGKKVGGSESVSSANDLLIISLLNYSNFNVFSEPAKQWLFRLSRNHRISLLLNYIYILYILMLVKAELTESRWDGDLRVQSRRSAQEARGKRRNFTLETYTVKYLIKLTSENSSFSTWSHTLQCGHIALRYASGPVRRIHRESVLIGRC